MLVFPIIFFLLFATVAGKEVVFAQEKQTVKYIDLQISIPGLGDKTTGLPQYLMYMYKFLVGSIGLIAVVMIMVGGFQWILAAGNSSRIEEAKSTIFSAVAGLLIALGSYTILNLINPNLTKLKVAALPKVAGDELKFQINEFANIVDCSTLPSDAVFKDSKERVSERSTLRCGSIYDATYEKKDTLGNKATVETKCYGTWCGRKGNCVISENGFPVGDDYVKGLCSEDLEAICNEKMDVSSPQSCFSTDSLFQDLGSRYICFYSLVGNDSCTSSLPLDCKDGLQVACDADGNNQCGVKGCVDPREGLAFPEYKKYPNNFPERVKGDSICCGKSKKFNIHCRKQSEGCNSDEVSLLPGKCESYNYESGPFASTPRGRYGLCNIGTEVCCMPVYLKNSFR